MSFRIRNYTSNILYIKCIKHWFLTVCVVYIVDIIIVYKPPRLVDMQM